MRHFRNVAFRQPRIHTLDHQAIVAFIWKGKVGKLKHYRKSRQTFPLQLPPAEEQDAQTRLFRELRATCEDNAPTQRKCSDWISEESWWLIAHRAMLRHTGRLCQTRGRRSNVKLVRCFARTVLTTQNRLELLLSPNSQGEMCRRPSAI